MANRWAESTWFRLFPPRFPPPCPCGRNSALAILSNEVSANRFPSAAQRVLESRNDRSTRSARSARADRDCARDVRRDVRPGFQRLRCVRGDVRQWKDWRVRLRSASNSARRRSSGACRNEYKIPDPANLLRDIFDNSERCRGAWCYLSIRKTRGRFSGPASRHQRSASAAGTAGIWGLRAPHITHS